MREIIFRAKRTDNGAWEFGDLQHVSFTTTKEETSEGNWCLKLSYTEVKIANYVVDVKTIGQYTGVKDRLGNAIFEGDILLQLTSVERYWIVEYKDGAFCACRDGNIYIALIDLASNIYVEGNIYDDPEILTD